MYAISTVGSLLGTFLSALLLIPLAGTQRTFLTFALALAIVAAIGLAAPLVARPARRRRAVRGPGRHRQGGRGRARDPRDRHRVPVRAGDRPRRRRAHARAQRGPGDPLALPPRQRAHRRLLGRLPRRAVRHPPRPAAPGRDARLRRRHRRARLRALLPGTRASTASRSTASCSTSAAATSACARARSCASTPRTRGRSCATRPPATTSIFLDTYRQPYIPFYLSTREFFELARDRLAPGGSVDRQPRPPRGPRRAREGPDRRRWGAPSTHVARDPIKPTNTLLIGSQTTPTRRQPARGGRAPAGRRCARSRSPRRPGSRRAR